MNVGILGGGISGLTLHRLQDVLDGDLDEIVNALIAHNQAEKLKEPAVR